MQEQTVVLLRGLLDVQHVNGGHWIRNSPLAIHPWPQITEARHNLSSNLAVSRRNTGATLVTVGATPSAIAPAPSLAAAPLPMAATAAPLTGRLRAAAAT